MTGYNIIAPPYRHNSAGIRALYILADELRARDCDVTVNGDDRHRITVYPEIVPVNAMGSPRPVWWLLNTADVPQPAWAWTEGISHDPLLTVNVIELDLFHPRPGPRKGIAWWAHKGGVVPDLIPPGAVQITHEWPPTREELADLLASVKAVVSFDGFTSLNAEAAMLGTPVICHGYTNKGVEFQIPGVAGTYAQAKEGVDRAFDEYVKWLPVFEQRIDAFVQRTQEMYP